MLLNSATILNLSSFYNWFTAKVYCVKSTTDGCSNSNFWQGAKDSQAIVLTYLPVSFAFGVSASQFGFSPWEAFFFLVPCMQGQANFSGRTFSKWFFYMVNRLNSHCT